MRSQGKKLKVFVAMSGGVDSSVAAALLKERGFDVVGCHMKCFNVDGCAEADAEDARRVAEQLRIPFYVFDFEDAYKRRVVDYMIRGYKAGITPNPDVMCNKEIKFGLFFERAMQLGAAYVATGHYVRRHQSTNNESSTNERMSEFVNSKQIRYSLMIAKDKNKDQSYFLWTLTQQQLQHCLFPIGDYSKPQIRKFAQQFGLLTAAKKDSQGICFLGEVSIRDFLKKYIKPKEGNVLTVDGRIVGMHDGAYLYTIGQRNLGIKNMALGTKGGHGAAPHYVIAKDLKKNTITIAPENHPTLCKNEIKLTNVNFISCQPSTLNPQPSFRVLARVRYRQPLAPARLLFQCSQAHEHKKVWMLIFDKPQQFVAEGQSAVFYAKTGEMLGGGIIVG